MDALKNEYLFQSLFLCDEAIVAFKHQRSIVTKLGQQLYPQLVVAMAKTQFSHVYRDYRMTITLDRVVWNTIGEIVGHLRAVAKSKIGERLLLDHERVMADILKVVPSGQMETRIIVLDIFITDFIPAPLYLELKTPKPNLNICAESKRKILAFEAFMKTTG